MDEQFGGGSAAPNEMRTVADGALRPATVNLKRMLIASDRAQVAGAENGAALEGRISDHEPLSADNGILNRLDLRIAVEREHAEAASDLLEIGTARETLMHCAAPALKKLEAGEVSLTENERGALEAVIIVDGTRPSFLFCDGLVDLNDPTMGAWLNMVSPHRAKTQRIARAVGRIQPSGGSAAKFVGTGSLVDAAKGLVLTNYHVIVDAKARGVGMTQSDRTIAICGDLVRRNRSS